MKQKILFLVIALTAFFNTQAYDFQVGYLCYNITSDTEPYTVEIARGCGYENLVTIIIPSIVDYEGFTYSVTAIGNYAFSKCHYLTTIEIPNSVTSIGDSAFYCASLSSIDIPNSVTSIGNNAFCGCSGLTSIVIPNTVTNIGDNAFYESNGLTNVVIPNSVVNIGNKSFANTDLTSVTIPNSVITIPNGAIPYAFSISDSTHVYFSQGNLQYNAAQGNHACADGSIKPGIWRFAENQLDVICDGNSLVSSTYDGWIDLFGWGTSGYDGKNPWMSSTDGEAYGAKSTDGIDGTYYDWGCYNAISNGGNMANVWRTLPSSELDYIVNRRANAANLHSMGVVNGRHGLILLPDNFIMPSSISFTPSCMEFTTMVNNYSQTEWDLMASKGAVFFPVAGHREGLVVSETDESGYYWSTDCYNSDPSAASEMWFGRMYIYYNPGIGGAASRSSAFSVRLVCDVPTATITLGVNSTSLGTTSGSGKYEIGDTITITAHPKTNCCFTSWSDGNEDNPRTLILTQDTNLIANFDLDKLTITLLGSHGKVQGAGTYKYGETATISAIPDYGYQFEYWKDLLNTVTAMPTDISSYSTSGIVKVSTNTYNVTIPVQYVAYKSGSCSSDLYCEIFLTSPSGKIRYISDCSINPNYYKNSTHWTYGHFTKYGDYVFFDLQAIEQGTWTIRLVQENAGGWYCFNQQLVKPNEIVDNAQYVINSSDNPRTVVLRCDTTIFAQFGPATKGTCGENLTWSLDTTTWILTISGQGTMYDYSATNLPEWYLSFNKIKSVVIGDGVTSIGTYAFNGCNGLNSIEISKSVNDIGDNAFANCVGLKFIKVKWEEPISINANVFINISLTDITLYVPQGVKDKYESSEILKDFNVVGVNKMVRVSLYTNYDACGTVSGFGEYEANGAVAVPISATPNKGYHFVKWSNGSTKITDTITVSSNKALMALFEKCKPVTDDAVVATCTATGLTEGSHCSVCNSVLVAQQVTSKVQHTAVIDSAVAATCAAIGLTEGSHCSVCNSVLVAQQVTSKVQHTAVIDSAVAATCTAIGLTEGSHCSVCNSVLVAQKTIAKLGHSFTNYIYNNDATAEADGTETAICDHACGATDTHVAEGTKLLGIEDADVATVNIYAIGSTIIIENATAEISVYDATGRCVAKRQVDGDRIVMAMPHQGLYIVRTGDTAQRVVVE